MRKRIFAALSFAVACAASSVLNAAPFTPGNIVVYRIGDGSTTLGGVGHPVFLDEFTPSGGTPVQSIQMPSTGSGSNLAFNASGTSTTDGLLTRSADGKCLVAPGYGRDLNTGSGNIAGTGTLANTGPIPRVVARISAAAGINTTTALTDIAIQTNMRSAASDDCSRFWVTSNTSSPTTTSGVHFATLGATTSTDLTSTVASGSFRNVRAIGIFNGQLYASSGATANTYLGVETVGTGLPTSGTPIVTRLNGLTDTTNPSSYAFFFADLDAGVAGLDTLYIADDNGSTANIQKFSFDGTVWTARGAIGLSNSRGLTGIVSGTTVTLFVTNGTSLQKLTDTSGFAANITGTLTSIASAGTNRVFRGVALAPDHPVSVTSSAGTNGSITPVGIQQFQLGLTATFTVTPDPTYAAVVGGTCGGTLVGNTYTTNVLTADCTVDATFTSSPTFTVTPTANGNGTISPNTPQTVNSGDTAVFTVTPAANNTVSMNGTCGGVLNMNTYTTAAITANCTVIANFSPITHAVTPSAGANGTISPSTPQTINQGTTTTFSVTPDAGFSASVGGTCGGTLVGTTYTTAVITAPCTVDATFAPLPTYTVTGTAGANGSIAPTMAQTITQGNTATFTITPNAGYNAAVRGTCGGTLVGTTYTTRPITANCTVDAVFAKKVVLFVGNSYTFGRIDPVMSYNTANVTDLTQAMWIADPTGSNVDEPHPWGGIPGVFKKMTDQLGLEYDVSISARNAASLRGHYLNTNPANWDLRGNVASQRWNSVVFQDLSDEPLPAGRAPNANLPYFNAYADKFEAWVHNGAVETYTETQLFGGGNAATCATVTGASTGTCNTVRTISPANPHANAATDVYLYQTWARPDLIAPNGTNAGGTTYSAAEGLELQTQHFADAYFGRAAGNANIKGVNPVGNAFLLAVQSGIAMRDPYVPEPGKINLWHTDYFHPSKYGSYLSALVHTAMISGIDPTTLGAGELSAIDLGISSTDAVALQQAAKAAVVPPAPSIGTAIPGNGQVTVNFTAANNVGRLALTGFTATCGAQSNSGASSPIVVSGLTNGTPVTCTVTASNSVGTGLASAASNSATPATSVAFTSSAPPNGTAGVAYNFTVTANGTPSPTFSVTAGALPTGLSLAAGGLISGTPTTGGVYTGTITATNGGSSDTQNFSITIAPGAQTITFPTLPAKVLGDAPFNAVAVASSGLTVTFSSTTTGVCTSGGTNGATITIVAVGTCTIAADQAGDINFAAAPQVLRSFNVSATAGAAIVISQVYGGGGNSGSVYKNDFIELFNRSGAPVNVTGWSVQYASSTGTSWQVTPLTGTIPPGGYFLVQEAVGAGGTTNLPTPDSTGTIPMAAGAGKVALVNNSTALTGGCPTASSVDFVGFGGANCFEGAAATPTPSATQSVFRAGNGCTDTNSNSADFALGTTAPRNSASPTNACSSLPGLSVSDVTLAEGNAGTTTFAFTVTLSTPAGAGGVLFDIATANGSATAGSDYASQSLTSVTIPQGMTSYTFNVAVNGDTIAEGNETFTVNVTNVAGANVVKATGTGTITNDDAGVDLNINDVSANEGDSGTTTFTFTVSLAGPAPVGGVSFDIATANGTATAGSDYLSQTLVNQTIPAGMTSYTFAVTVSGDTAPEQNETFFVNVTNVNNAIGVKTQGIGTIVNDDAIRIHTVQGTGNTSPFAGQIVTVEGVVTFVSQGTNSLLGYFIQEPDANADADPATSEGIFVFTNATPASVNIGDLVRVTGPVAEFGTAPNTLTEIGNPTTTPTTQVLSSNNGLPAFVTVTLPVTVQGELERYEGMRVRFTQTLTVSDHFDLAQYGEITVTANGRAIQPTNEVDPNDDPASGTSSSGTSNVAAVNAHLDLSRRSGVIIDGAYNTYPGTVPFLDPMTNTIRLGSTVSDVTGILSQIGGTHRVYPDVAPVFTYAPRPVASPAVGGNVKVGSMNVLNYFNGDGVGGGFPTSRGADTLVEFNRQRAKVIAAASGLGADVIGLLEIENDGNGTNSAIQDLINGLNASQGPGTWAFIPDPVGYTTLPGGTDLIKPAIIYRPSVVTPSGLAQSPNDAAFNQARAPIAQAFTLNSNGEKFTLVINHFKSKGSGSGANADQGDGQGASNADRKLQAQALLNFIATLTPTSPRVLAMGDFNAYEQEDPMDIMRAGGLTPLIVGDPSYLFDGLSGSLDHALATPAALSVVSGAAHWHINADEPVLLDYNVENKNHPNCVTAPCTNPDLYAADPFRASDHDPVLVGLQLDAPATQCLAGTYSATGNTPCTPADPGNYVPTPGATSQTQCSAGSFQGNSGASSCTPASAGNFVSLPGATAQTQCLAGTYSSASGAASCTPASPGNFVAMPGATGQTQCSAGSFQANSSASACDPASAGNFVPAPGSSTQTACTAGTYQPSTGASSCLPADAGSYATGPGATTQTACAAGSYSAMSGTATCTPASPGNFVGMSGATGQTQCSAGSFQANSGASACDPASAGNFVAAPGSSTQTACTAGTYQPNTGASSCVPADAGSYATGPGATAQTACLAGSYSSMTGASVCTPAGPGNFVSSPGATGQTPCSAGSYQGNSGQSSCTPASPGFFVPSPGASSQSACPNGSTSLVSGATACIPLYTVTLSTSSGGSISPSGAQSVAQGQTTSFTLTADSGYRIGNVSGTCGGALTGNTYTTAAVTADCTVIASFVQLLTFNIVLEGAQETPPNVSTGTGSGTAVVDTVDNTITLNLTFSGLTGTVNNAHLHGPADRGVAAGVKIGIGQSSPITDVVSYSEADEADILAGKWYVNIHSTAFPGGELRGQLDNLGAADKLLTVSTDGTGNGAITAAGINCPGDCSQSYPHNTQVMLTATPATGSTFAGWSGACSGTGSCVVTMDFVKTVNATFTLNTYTVTATAGSGGAISPSGAISVNHGAVAIFTLSPGVGYTASVGGTCGGTLVGNTYTTATITRDCAVSASFTLNTYALTVAVTGTGSGAVTGTGIACPGDCSETFSHGSMVTLTATPSTGSTFAGWSGACSGTGSCVVTMDAAKSVTAGFTLNTYTVTPSAGSNGSISPSTAQTVSHGATTTFTVTPNAGYSTSVGGTCGGTLTGITYTTAAITANCTVAATFTFIPVVPNAPVIGTVTPGDGQASVGFSAPGFDGGATISSYTATCGSQSASGSTSPIIVTGLTNFVAVNCSVVATNSVGTSAASASVSVTPQPALMLTGALSQKIHDSAGPFNMEVDITAPINGAITVEPRAIGAGHTIIFQFNVPITVAGTATVVDATSASAGTATATAIANQVQVTLTGVADNKRVTVSLTGINGSGNASLSMAFLIGDTNNSRAVDAIDVSGVRARAGQQANGGNFRYDLNASGVITAADIAAVKARVGTTLP